MSVTVDVSGETLTLTTEDKKIGVWSLRDVEVDSRSDGFHLKIDGEEVILAVSESARFATELPLDLTPKRPPSSVPSESTATTRSVASEGRIGGLIGGLGQEDKLADVRHQVNDLRAAMRDPSIPPAVVFSRWLALLKVLNRRHGQGAMPTPVFFRLNTELLDLMPVPASAEPRRVDSGVAI